MHTKPRKLFLAALLPLMLTGITFFSCHDSIFEDINKESSIGDDRIKGGATGFVTYGNCVYIAPLNEGVIYRKAVSDRSIRGNWDPVPCPQTPVYLAVKDGYLYMLTTVFESGSGDDEGINLPVAFYEYRTKDPGNWEGPLSPSPYAYDKAGTYIPDYYKNPHTKVTTATGSVYSIATNSNVLYQDNIAILYADQDDVKVGSWWCLAGTSDQLLLGTSTGLFHMPIGSTDINNDVAPNDLSSAKSIFSGMTILALYVAGTSKNATTGAWDCASTSETDSVIYVFATGAGSAYASQNGLYSYIPGQGWDSEF